MINNYFKFCVHFFLHLSSEYCEQYENVHSKNGVIAGNVEIVAVGKILKNLSPYIMHPNIKLLIHRLKFGRRITERNV
jgi:hypothetical protein